VSNGPWVAYRCSRSLQLLLLYYEMIPVDVLDRYYPLQKPNTRNGTAVLKWKGLVKNACGYAYFS
jgi:hypothetical protein